jgi:hypothetical protein
VEGHPAAGEGGGAGAEEGHGGEVHDGRERTGRLCHLRPNLLPDAAGRGKVILSFLTFIN